MVLFLSYLFFVFLISDFTLLFQALLHCTDGTPSIIHFLKAIDWGNSTAQNSTTRHGTARHGTTGHNLARHGSTLHDTAQLGTARLNIPRHRKTRHITIQLNTAQHNTTWHDMAQHGRGGQSFAKILWIVTLVSFLKHLQLQKYFYTVFAYLHKICIKLTSYS